VTHSYNRHSRAASLRQLSFLFSRVIHLHDTDDSQGNIYDIVEARIALESWEFLRYNGCSKSSVLPENINLMPVNTTHQHVSCHFEAVSTGW